MFELIRNGEHNESHLRLKYWDPSPKYFACAMCGLGEMAPVERDAPILPDVVALKCRRCDFVFHGTPEQKDRVLVAAYAVWAVEARKRSIERQAAKVGPADMPNERDALLAGGP